MKNDIGPRNAIMISFLTLALSTGIEAFSIFNNPMRRTTCLSAKPPPKASFDLESLEAYEQQLDAVTQLEEGYDVEEDLLLDSSSSEALSYPILADLHNLRIDAAMVACQPQLSRSTCVNMIADGLVWLVDEDDRKMPVHRKSHKVQQGQTLQLLLSAIGPQNLTHIQPEKIHLDILFEDKHMIVINKAAGMVVHPAVGHWNGTLCNALAYYLTTTSPYGPGDFADDETIADETSFRPGIVHRIDKGTTGIIVVAKSKDALAKLSQAFKDRRVKKAYLAITVGNPGSDVKIDKPIERHPIHRQRMRVVPDPHRSSQRQLPTAAMESKGRKAMSFVDSVVFNGKLALAQVRIITGRTHQVRVHLQDRKTPIYGDTVYGLADWNKKLYKTHQLDRPLLHAYRLQLEHPITGKVMDFDAPLPEDMIRIAKTIDESFERVLAEQFHLAATMRTL
ncbi:hypothetical protein MPSEU_000483500 [Mayamaea pseudoterrestris]|nr:hypothetical protein MPSEU_000483500 [Mayamaea pseudoterrestris]